MTDKPVSERASVSDEAKEIEWLCGLLLSYVSYDKHHLVHELETLARRLLEERNEAQALSYKQGFIAAGKEIVSRDTERIASLEREVASYEGMSAAVDHYQEEVRRLERLADRIRALKSKRRA